MNPKQEYKNAGRKNAIETGRLYGIIAISLVYFLFLTFDMIHHQMNFEISAMYCSYFGFDLLGRYRVTKKKILLFEAMLGIIAAIMFMMIPLLNMIK